MYQPIGKAQQRHLPGWYRFNVEALSEGKHGILKLAGRGQSSIQDTGIGKVVCLLCGNGDGGFTRLDMNFAEALPFGGALYEE